MSSTQFIRNRRGVALLTVMLVAFAASAIALAAVMMTLNANLVGKNTERVSVVDAAAIAGLEEARSRLNGTRGLYPNNGYVTLENNAQVRDASNASIPTVFRSTYIGPSGITSGQYGVVGSIISVANDGYGNRVVRRLEVNQESFSKFAYFTNEETDTTGSTVVFASGDQLRGPVHSNDQIRIGSSPSPAVTFYDQVTTAAGSINNQSNGSFIKPPLLSQPRIPMPTVADLNKLDSLAQVGSTRFAGSMSGDAGEARTRVHFLTIDLGSPWGVQGFFMVYQAGTTVPPVAGVQPEDFVSASTPTGTSSAGNNLELSLNCGDFGTGGRFMPAYYHDTTGLAAHLHVAGSTNTNKIARRDSSLSRGTSSRCYLGGDSILTKPAIATGSNATWPTNGHPDGGAWVAAPGAIQSALAALGSVITNRPDANYLFPLNRQWNSRFKGIVFVGGKVIVDGVIHGRVTVAATGNVVFGDDVTYYQGITRDCTTGDIAGYFSGQSLLVSNNTLNAPQIRNNDGAHSTSPSGTFRSYDETTDETIHGFFLTLRTFGAEENNLGSDDDEQCRIGGTFDAGRGCLVTFGGIIQENRGAVGLTSGEGYVKRYQYDACGATDPPPYYPTTGVFIKNRFYELDPTRFSVAGWFAANQN